MFAAAIASRDWLQILWRYRGAKAWGAIWLENVWPTHLCPSGESDGCPAILHCSKVRKQLEPFEVMSITQYLIEDKLYASLEPVERAWRITNIWKHVATTRNKSKEKRDSDLESVLALPYKPANGSVPQWWRRLFNSWPRHHNERGCWTVERDGLDQALVNSESGTIWVTKVPE